MRKSQLKLAAGGLFLLAGSGFACAGTSVVSAVSVVSYDPGDFTAVPYYKPFQDSSTARGLLQGDTTFGGLTPFNPPFASGQFVAIGAGGELTLKLGQSVQTLGVFSNAGLNDVSIDGSGLAGNPAQTLDELFGESDPQAIVEVSQNGGTFVALNGGKPIAFTNPTNYYLDQSINSYSEPLGTVVADQGKPFTGSLSDFNGRDFDQIKTLLDGSAGGNWLDLTGTGLGSVDEIRFSVPMDAGYGAVIDSVSGQSVPEPAMGVPICVGMLLLLLRKRCRQVSPLA